MGYLADELKNKRMEKYIPMMERIMMSRELNGQYEPLRCFECFYSIFGHCPTNGSHNAACLTMQKRYMDMDPKELKKITEKEYKEELIKAAKMYNVRMNYINSIFELKGEKQEEEQDEALH